MEDKLTYLLIGAAITLIIGAVNAWFKKKSERREKMNSSLFFLLEIHHFLHSLKHLYDEDFSLKMVNKIKQEHDDEDLDSKVLLPFLRAGMACTVNSSFVSTPDFKKTYYEAIQKLAEIEPVLAFEISSKDQIITSVNTIHLLLKKASPETEEVLMNILASQMFSEAIDSLNYDIQILSKKAGFKTHYTVKEKLRAVNSKFKSLTNEEFEQFYEDNLLPMIDKFKQSVALDTAPKEEVTVTATVS